MFLRHFTLISVILLNFGTLFGKSYSNLLLMEFENVSNNSEFSHLQQSLPDLVKENFAFRQDITISYAGELFPFFKSPKTEKISGLLVNGQFTVDGTEIIVLYEILDINTWDVLEKRSYSCQDKDLICIHNAMVFSIEESLNPYLIDDGDDQSSGISKRETQPTETEIEPNLPRQTIVHALDNLAAEADFHISINHPSNDRGQYGDRYYRDFDVKDLVEPTYPSIEKNTEQLITLLNQILVNPYNVEIGELEAELDPFDDTMAQLNVPVEYSVKSNLIQDLLTTLPHSKFDNKNGVVILQFSNEEFLFDDILLDKLSLMEYQVIPLIMFSSKSGALQSIILDSWEKKYDYLTPHNVSFSRQHKFTPLLAITPGPDNIQVTIDTSTILADYSLNMDLPTLEDYTKMTVKFFHESDLDTYLTVTLSNK
jgi:hypothetical protein